MLHLMLIRPDNLTQILEMSISQRAGISAPGNMLELLEAHVMDLSDSAKCFQGLFAIFWRKTISPTLQVEEIL